MKIMVASDIHGSAYYCGQLLQRFHEELPSRMLLLGDLLYHGPRNELPKEYAPKEVISMLNGIKESLVCVRGNCDAEVDQMVLEFPIMADSCIMYWNERQVFAAHGHQFNPENPPLLYPGDILLNGHTHVSNFRKVGTFYYMNPGSVSIPKMDTPHGYMVFEDDRITYKTLAGAPYREVTLEPLVKG